MDYLRFVFDLLKMPRFSCHQGLERCIDAVSERIVGGWFTFALTAPEFEVLSW